MRLNGYVLAADPDCVARVPEQRFPVVQRKLAVRPQIPFASPALDEGTGRANRRIVGMLCEPLFLLFGHRALIPVFAALVMLSACSTTSGSYCAINRPLVYSDAVIDQMTDAEVERTLAALETHRRLCGRKR